MDLASTLLNRREELQMKKSDVTKRVGDVTHQAVTNWETGISIPTDAHLIQLSEILQLDLLMLQQLKAQALADLDLHRSQDNRNSKKSINPEFKNLSYLNNKDPQSRDKVRASDSNDREPENAWSSIVKGIKKLFG
jgi:DNA-binding XRE family transcriptional regulator